MIIIKEDRYQKILDILDRDKCVHVEALSQQLFVSMPTIRRDLNEMQHRGLVVRSHGGAMRVQDIPEPPLFFRTGTNPGEKLKLSKAASSLLRDDCTVFMDESTTTLHIIDQIPEYRNIRVVTNSMSVIMLLDKYKIPAYCLGGALNSSTMSFVGNIAEEDVRRFGIDIMFFSSSGINRHGWVVDYCEEANSLRRRVFELADTKVFLCDKSKYGKNDAHALTPISQLDYMVLNSPLPDYLDPGQAKLMIV